MNTNDYLLYNKEKLDAHYNSIFEQNKEKLLQGGTSDDFLRSPDTDSRMSLALLVRIKGDVAENVMSYLEQIKDIEPDLYFYPKEDLHITVLDILRGIPNREIPENLQEYIRCIQECIDQTEPFTITFQGTTASDNAVLVKGYYEHGLEKLRELLRKTFMDNHVLLEERYKTFSSHITVARIATHLTKPEAFTQHLINDDSFGKMYVESLELVFHNWYDSKKTVLANFELKKAPFDGISDNE